MGEFGGAECAATGCESAASSRGFCSAHYEAARDRGDFGGTPCAHPGCTRMGTSRGLCRIHYGRARRG